MTEHKGSRRQRQRKKRDRSDMIAICLLDAPRTVLEIEQQFIAFGRRLGIFVDLVDQEALDRGDLTQGLLVDLEKMTETGWVERQE